MKLSILVAECLIAMQIGGKIPYSKIKTAIVDDMIDNGILRRQIQGRTKALVYLTNPDKLKAYLENHLGIESLEGYVEGLRKENLTRAEAVDISSNSKLIKIRTFKGFLVNCFQPLKCMLNKEEIILLPHEGTFVFIYDFEHFYPTEDATIVGIENPENFRYIEKQRKLFEDIKPLFVSRYPHSQDLIKWLQAIPNPYLHFGDFDFSGLNIYINEFKKHLPEKASFFLHPDVEKLLEKKGSRDNYDNQTILFDKNEIKEENVLALLEWIEKFKKGLEQEIFAK